MLPAATAPLNLPRFQAKVPAGTPDACWEWTGARASGEYGVLRVQGHNVYAHRIAYANSTGEPVPAAMLVCHRCDNPPCCNPAHLFLGTSLDNSRDQKRKGRKLRGPATAPKHPARGADNTNSKLTPDKVREARRMRGMGRSQQAIATSLGVHQTAISSLLRGRTWRHI